MLILQLFILSSFIFSSNDCGAGLFSGQRAMASNFEASIEVSPYGLIGVRDLNGKRILGQQSRMPIVFPSTVLKVVADVESFTLVSRNLIVFIAKEMRADLSYGLKSVIHIPPRLEIRQVRVSDSKKYFAVEVFESFLNLYQIWLYRVLTPAEVGHYQFTTSAYAKRLLNIEPRSDVSITYESPREFSIDDHGSIILH